MKLKLEGVTIDLELARGSGAQSTGGPGQSWTGRSV